MEKNKESETSSSSWPGPQPAAIGGGHDPDNVWHACRPKLWNFEREEQQYLQAQPI